MLLLKKLFSLLLCIVLLGSFALAESSPEVSLFAVSAGKADALLLQVNGHALLIDTGYVRSRGRILYAMKLLGIEALDGVFITHTDNDHTDGLEWLAQSDIPVGAWYASAMYTGVKEGKHPAQLAAAERGEEVIWLQTGDQLTYGDAVLDVLAPGKLFEDKDDNNSLVMMLRTAQGNILLSGDMEYTQEEWLLNSGADLNCDVLKVANHADNDTGSEAFILSASPSVAVISTDSYEKPETPDPTLLSRLTNVGAEIAETQSTDGGVWVRLTDDGVTVQYADLPLNTSDVRISEIVPTEDRFLLTNYGGTDADLSGWYLLTDKKNSLFVFPEGTVLAPGSSLTIGGDAAGACDLRWDDKKIVNKKKPDGLTLYDQNGAYVSSADNGL